MIGNLKCDIVVDDALKRPGFKNVSFHYHENGQEITGQNIQKHHNNRKVILCGILCRSVKL